MDLKEQIKALCKANNMTFKELADKANMNSNSLHNKFQRQSLTVKDLQSLLSILGKEIGFIDKQR